MKYSERFKIWFLTGLMLFVGFHSFCQSSELNYLPTSSVIANPERGWYDDYYNFGNYLTGNYKPLDAALLKSNRENDKITIILRSFYLHQFLEEDSVSNDYLDKMQADFDAARYAGVKCIVRFAYSNSQSADVWDAPPDIVLSHIQSLSNVLKKNSDVILAVQAGFVGVWGEWYYTTNFSGSGYVPDSTDQANRRAVVLALLDILPENIQVQVRTPAIKQTIIQDETPISEEEAYSGTDKSRIGHHNDCFLANRSDYGTYTNLEEDIAYLSQETKYAIAGGETCDASNSYSDCENSIPRMKELHWTFLNRGYNQNVYKKWQDQGCLHEVNLALGYRIYLDSAILPDSADAASVAEISLQLKNIGFAAPTQYKPFQIVLTNIVSHQQVVLPFNGTNSDIRFWFPGDIATNGTFTLPDTLQDGNYSIGLRFPDQSSSLETTPAYAIHLANTGIWDSVNGVNDLNHLITIGSGGPGELPEKPLSIIATVFSDSQINLSWDNSVENTDWQYIEIYRCINDDNDWQLIATLTDTTLGFSDKNLSSSTSYSYILRTVNEYGKSDWTQVVSASTLSNEIYQGTENSYKVYPNPFRSGDLYIQNTFNRPVQVTILDFTGKMIYRSIAEGSTICLRGLDLTPGLYFVNIQSDNHYLVRKLIVN